MKLIILTLFCCTLVYGKLDLVKKKQLKFPYNGANNYAFGRDAVHKAAYDDFNQRLYILGDQTGNDVDRLLYVVKIDELDDQSKSLSIEHTHSLPAASNGRANDIKICKTATDFVVIAVSVENALAAHEGFVYLYSPYTPASPRLTELQKIHVGFDPKGMAFTTTCDKLIIAEEGRVQGDTDPEGGVTYLSFPNSNYVLPPYKNEMTFQKFQAFQSSLMASGVRYVHRKDTQSGFSNEFYMDLEPDSVAISTNDMFAYVSLPTNNAIAEVDISGEEGNITRIIPLGYKTWILRKFDGSDMDGGPHFPTINLDSFRSMYQPTGVAIGELNSVDYMFTINQGRIRTPAGHPTWSEATNVNQLYQDGDRFDNSLLAEYTLNQLTNNSIYGRLMVNSGLDANDPLSDKIRHLTTFGGRGFTQWRLSDFARTYDSRDNLEKYESETYPSTFNGESNDPSKKPIEQQDMRSTTYGPEPTSLALGRVAISSTESWIFGAVGTASGTLHLYSYIDNIVFESITRSGGIDHSWNDLYNANNTGDPGITDIGAFIVTGTAIPKSYIYVIAEASGTVSIYEVVPSAGRRK